MTKKTLDQVLKAIENTGGVKYVVAQKLGVSRSTLDRYLAKWSTAAQALRDEDEDTGDMAEAVIKRNIELAIKFQTEKKIPADSGDAWRWLTTRRRERFSSRQEITGPGGGPLTWRQFIESGEDDDPGASSE